MVLLREEHTVLPPNHYWQLPLHIRIMLLVHLGKSRVLQLRVIFTKYKEKNYVKDKYHTQSSVMGTEMDENPDIVIVLK